MNQPRFAFAGDRDISVRVLDFLLGEGARPLALMVSGKDRATHDRELIARCPFLPAERILAGTSFREPAGASLLRELDLDFVLGIHFPYVVPEEVLAIPRDGFVNLHPAYLPYNRGWHTPSWAILDGTPYGATLHFMSREIDGGDIIHQKEIAVSDADTADDLYRRAKDLELRVFQEAWPLLSRGKAPRAPQNTAAGTVHGRNELLSPDVQELALDATTSVRDVLRRLRALSTNRLEEAASFVADGKRYRVRVSIVEDGEVDASRGL